MHVALGTTATDLGDGLRRHPPLPSFLIIGAMKAGTTTLFSDLCVHPLLHGAEDKEPDALAEDRVLSPAGEERYRRLFRRAGPRQLCFEASTSYTKLPTYPGVAARGRRLLGDTLKVIYVLREPVSRALSHHRYALAHGLTNLTDVRAAVREEPTILDYSRYGMQIRPWVDELGADQVLLVGFEEYVASRRKVLDTVCTWLGVGPMPADVPLDIAYNRSDDIVMLRRGIVGWWRRSRLYRELIRPRLSLTQRHVLKRLLPRSRTPAQGSVDAALRSELTAIFARDLADLHRMFGQRVPRWDARDSTHEATANDSS